MPSQNADAGKRIKWWLNHFWPLSLNQKIQRLESLEKIVVVPNALGFIENMPASMRCTRLVLDTGGFLTPFAGAFGRFSLDILCQGLDVVKDGRDLPDNAKLLIPRAMAQSLRLENSEQLNGFTISFVADLPWEIISQDVGNKSEFLPAWMMRTIFALPLILGQMSVFAFALLVFGLPVLLFGEITLLIAGLMVAACWKIIGAHGSIRGLLIGLGASLVGGVTALTLPAQADIAWKFASGLLLCSLWMGIVYEGVR